MNTPNDDVTDSVLRTIVKNEKHFVLIVLKGKEITGGFEWGGTFACHCKGMPIGEGGWEAIAQVLQHAASTVEGKDG